MRQPIILSPPVVGGIRVDAAGDGHFGSPRGSRLHAGLDLLAEVGEPVKAPCEVNVLRVGQCYANSTALNLVELAPSLSRDARIKILYTSCIVRPGAILVQGQVIGYAQDVAGYHGRPMKNHIHLEVDLSRGALLGRGSRPDDRVRVDPLFFLEMP